MGAAPFPEREPSRDDGRDTRPYARHGTPSRYAGPVPIVTHVHGAVGVGDESDGYAEAWYLPQAGNIPAGYATEGTWYEFVPNGPAYRVTGGVEGSQDVGAADGLALGSHEHQAVALADRLA